MEEHTNDEITKNESQEYRFVGMWSRFAARLIDGLIISVIGSPFMVTIFIIVFSVSFRSINAGVTGTPHYTVAQSLILGLCSLGYLIVTMLYYSITTSSKLQGTLGKRMLGYKVITTDGGRLNFGKAFMRYLYVDGISIPGSLMGQSTNAGAQALVAVFGFLSFAWIVTDASIGGADAKKQALHDRLAKTYVVYR